MTREQFLATLERRLSAPLPAHLDAMRLEIDLQMWNGDVRVERYSGDRTVRAMLEKARQLIASTPGATGARLVAVKPARTIDERPQIWCAISGARLS